MKDNLKRIFKGGLGQLTIPLIAIALLVIFNLIRDPSFFSIELTLNNNGNTVLSGNLISIINGLPAADRISVSVLQLQLQEVLL